MIRGVGTSFRVAKVTFWRFVDVLSGLSYEWCFFFAEEFL